MIHAVQVGDVDSYSANSQCGGVQSMANGAIATATCSPPLLGRYVFVTIPGDNKILTMCELEVQWVSWL